jgi:hypothetical protein
METTLEVRWFINGSPPLTVQHWFKFDCPGELFNEKQPEIRKDWYCSQNWHNLERLTKFLAIAKSQEQEDFNLKLREGQHLELKWRKQQLGTEKFGNFSDSAIWQGNIEQWCKLSQKELVDCDLSISNLVPENTWIPVDKKREQKREQGITSELTLLNFNNDFWWSIAFEMAYNLQQKQPYNCFKKFIDRACQNYSGPQLLKKNSFSYSHWLLKI